VKSLQVLTSRLDSVLSSLYTASFIYQPMGIFTETQSRTHSLCIRKTTVKLSVCECKRR